ncbi:MAG: serine hydrolase domain-containing protein [Alphaproteobacteria bacterium]
MTVATTMRVPVAGVCQPRFAAVRRAFERVMNSDTPAGREIGACVSVVLDGVTVVDLWGGFRDRARTLPWEPDTITCMMSVAKASASVCAHVLIDRGLIDPEATVASYWPEFGQAGKERMTVRELLSHRGGVLYADAAPAGSLWQAGVVERALEAQAPEWVPGTDAAYHSFTYGPLVEGLVRRVSGLTIGQFFRAEVAAPLGLDYQIGLTDAEDARCAEFEETRGTPSRDGIKENPASPLFRAWAPLPKSEDFNSRDWRRGEFASANGHGNARAIARLYGCLARGGEIDGVRLLSERTVADVTREHWDGMDRMTNRNFRFGAGFMLSCPPMPMGGHRRNFGHMGLGGAVGFGDPVRRLGFSYCGNRMAPIADEGPFGGPLVAATYEALA